MSKKIRTNDGTATAVFCPRVRAWRIVVTMGWGRDVYITALLDEATFITHGFGWPGAHGYCAHATRVTRPWGGYGLRAEPGCQGLVKAHREVARWGHDD